LAQNALALLSAIDHFSSTSATAAFCRSLKAAVRFVHFVGVDDVAGDVNWTPGCVI
jgi:hypothetical protein